MWEIEVSRIDFSAKKIEAKRDFVAEEAPLHIFLNQTHYVTILCSPDELKELAVGHLLSEGVLKSIDEIREIRLEADGKCRIRLKQGVDAEKRISISQPFSRLIVSACGIVLKSARMRIPIVASITAAISSGIETAQRTGTTLIGFVRGKKDEHLYASGTDSFRTLN